MRHTAPPQHIALQPLHMPAGGHAAPVAPLAAGQTGKALRFSIAFFVFGLLNNALYVVILT